MKMTVPHLCIGYLSDTDAAMEELRTGNRLRHVPSCSGPLLALGALEARLRASRRLCHRGRSDLIRGRHCGPHRRVVEPAPAARTGCEGY